MPTVVLAAESTADAYPANACDLVSVFGVVALELKRSGRAGGRTGEVFTEVIVALVTTGDVRVRQCQATTFARVGGGFVANLLFDVLLVDADSRRAADAVSPAAMLVRQSLLLGRRTSSGESPGVRRARVLWSAATDGAREALGRPSGSVGQEHRLDLRSLPNDLWARAVGGVCASDAFPVPGDGLDAAGGAGSRR